MAIKSLLCRNFASKIINRWFCCAERGAHFELESGQIFVGGKAWGMKM